MVHTISEELKTIADNLFKQGKMRFFDPAVEKQIIEFEKNNRITLPSKYKEWLLFSDGGECFLPAGVQFYGVAHKPFIDVNDNSRPDNNYVVIGALASGDPILIRRNLETVSIFNLEAGRIEDDEIYDDFFTFLMDLSRLLGIEE